VTTGSAISSSLLVQAAFRSRLGAHPRGILEVMTTSVRRHLASSPFQPAPEPTIELYALNDLVSHDSYGMGRVTRVEPAAVTVDFRSQTVRIPSPFDKMTKL
jgi:hypothetical protein